MITVRNQNHHNSRFPFTSSQWQELEHQALAYKYMISGMPIPPFLLFSIKTSLMDSSSSLIQFPHQPFGWDYFHMGYGRKIDTEPGRCKRTDGKKWRCSKEAFGDSKYCERHMHRGRNRSRKPVESRSEKDLIRTGPISALVGDSWLLEPFAVNNSSPSLADYQNDLSYLQLHNSPITQKQDQDHGRYNQKLDGKEEARKVMHRFFDESPHNDNADHNKDNDKDSSTTRLSITSSAHNFLLTRNDK